MTALTIIILIPSGRTRADCHKQSILRCGRGCQAVQEEIFREDKEQMGE